MATPVRATEAKTGPCECCFCGVRNTVRLEPNLHTCHACGRDFRVFLNARGTAMDLSSAAKHFYQHAPKIA